MTTPGALNRHWERSHRGSARRVFFKPRLNDDLTAVSRAVVVENKWPAQRYGIHGTFVDEVRRREVSFTHWLDQVIDEVAADAEALGCLDEVVYEGAKREEAREPGNPTLINKLQLLNGATGTSSAILAKA